MKRYQSISLLSIILLLLCGYMGWVQHNGVNKDPFYEDPGRDAMRIPLIKPYEMLKIDERLGWSITLQVPPSEKAIYYYLDIHGIREVAIKNGIIMVHTNYTQEVDKDIGQKILYWFVIIPDQRIETGFGTEAEFINYINTYGIQQPLWVKPDAAYKQFDKTGCLDWIPNCN